MKFSIEDIALNLAIGIIGSLIASVLYGLAKAFFNKKPEKISYFKYIFCLSYNFFLLIALVIGLLSVIYITPIVLFNTELFGFSIGQIGFFNFFRTDQKIDIILSIFFIPWLILGFLFFLWSLKLLIKITINYTKLRRNQIELSYNCYMNEIISTLKISTVMYISTTFSFFILKKIDFSLTSIFQVIIAFLFIFPFFLTIIHAMLLADREKILTLDENE